MNIYVGNLSPDITEHELCLEFGVFGEVTAAVIIRDKYTGTSRINGHGFVEMASKSAGAAAVAALRGRILKNMAIDVVEALPLSDKRMHPPGAGRIERQAARDGLEGGCYRNLALFR